MGQYQKSLVEDLFDPKPAPINHSPALFIRLPANTLPNKLAPNVPINMLRNPSFYSLASF